jgi:hypothetical protein
LSGAGGDRRSAAGRAWGGSAGPEARWTLFRPLDLAVAILLLASAAAFLPLLASPFGSRAEVTLDGRKVARLALDGPRRHLDVATALGNLRLAYGEGAVRVAEAPCPNRLCIRAGAVSRSGATITCLPAKVRVEIAGGRAREVDAVTF